VLPKRTDYLVLKLSRRAQMNYWLKGTMAGIAGILYGSRKSRSIGRSSILLTSHCIPADDERESLGLFRERQDEKGRIIRENQDRESQTSSAKTPAIFISIRLINQNVNIALYSSRRLPASSISLSNRNRFQVC